MTKLHVIENDSWQVGILPETGGSIAFARIKHGDQWLDFMRPTPEAKYGSASDCASFILVPWSNRIRDSRFRFQGTDYQLTPSLNNAPAIHGVGRDFPWREDVAEPRRVALHFDSGDYVQVNFPFHFGTWMDFRLDGKNFVIVTTLRNEDSRPIPGGFGHHPYFQRELGGTRDSVQLEIPCAQNFELVDHMASAGPVSITPKLDFRQLRPPGSELIDDCLTGRQADKPVRFIYGASGREIVLYADPVFACIVLYTPLNQHFFAVEPVTNANDGFNLHEKGIPGTGVFVLQPGEQRSGEIRLEVR